MSACDKTQQKTRHSTTILNDSGFINPVNSFAALLPPSTWSMLPVFHRCAEIDATLMGLNLGHVCSMANLIYTSGKVMA